MKSFEARAAYGDEHDSALREGVEVCGELRGGCGPAPRRAGRLRPGVIGPSRDNTLGVWIDCDHVYATPVAVVQLPGTVDVAVQWNFPAANVEVCAVSVMGSCADHSYQLPTLSDEAPSSAKLVFDPSTS